jgi:O-antigen ligase
MTARVDPSKGLFLGGLGLCAALVGFLAGVDPKLALAAAIAAGFFLLVFVDLAAGLAVFGFFSFLELLELGSAISVGKLGGALLALAWLAVLATRYDARFDLLVVHPWMATTLGLFLGWSLLSASWANEAATAIAGTGRYALNALLFLIVFTAIRNRRQALMVTAAFVAGALAATVYGLFNVDTAVDAGRLTGAGLDPNELASVLVAGVALSAALAINLRRSPELWLASLAAGAFCLLGIFLTVSRGGVLALSAMLVAAIFFAGKWRLQAVLVTCLVLAATFVYFSAIAPPEVRERISSATQGQARTPDGRTTIWTVGWRMAKANPVIGVGSGNFQDSSKEYLLQPGAITRSDQILVAAPKVAHNTYLGVLAELGIVGLALFLTIIALSLASALKAARNFCAKGDVGSEALARGFAIALIGTLTADFFISQELNKQLWLLLGFGPALLSMSQNREEE